jgi:hypothetical protein
MWCVAWCCGLTTDLLHAESVAVLQHQLLCFAQLCAQLVGGLLRMMHLGGGVLQLRFQLRAPLLDCFQLSAGRCCC